MKITDITWLRLFGPFVHGQGGPGEGRIAKVVVRVDTDAGVYGLGEVDDFAGVYNALQYMKHYFQGAIRWPLIRSCRSCCTARCRRIRRLQNMDCWKTR